MQMRTFLSLATVIGLAACAPDPALEAIEHRFPDLPLTAAVATGPGGDVYVAEWMPDASLHRFRADGVPVEDWDAEAAAEHLHCPFALAVGSDGQIYVLSVQDDVRRARVHAFDPSGRPVRTIDLGEGGLDIATDAGGRLYVALADRNGIRVFDPDGGHLSDWLAADMPFSRPVSLTSDGRGQLIVADLRLEPEAGEAPVAVFVLTPTGEVLHHWEVEGLPGAQVVYDVAVDGEGRVILTGDAGLLRAYSGDGDLLAEFTARRAPGEPTPIPECPALLVPPRVAAGAGDLLYWSPSWDRAAHPPASLRVYRVDWGGE